MKINYLAHVPSVSFLSKSDTTEYIRPDLLQMHFSMEKATVPHSSTLAWKIPWMEEPGGLQSMGSLRVGHDWATSLTYAVALIPTASMGKERIVPRISGEGNGNPLQSPRPETPVGGGMGVREGHEFCWEHPKFEEVCSI